MSAISWPCDWSWCQSEGTRQAPDVNCDPGSLTFKQIASLRLFMCKLCLSLQGYCEGHLKTFCVRLAKSYQEGIIMPSQLNFQKVLLQGSGLSAPSEATDCSVLTLGLFISYFCAYISHWSGLLGYVSLFFPLSEIILAANHHWFWHLQYFSRRAFVRTDFIFFLSLTKSFNVITESFN